MEKIIFDIGTSNTDHPVLETSIDILACEIMSLVPEDQKKTMLRAINAGNDNLYECDTDGMEYEILRARLNDGTKIFINMRLKEIDINEEYDDDSEESYERKIQIIGGIESRKLCIFDGVVNIESLPESIISQDYSGKSLSDLIDSPLVEGIQILPQKEKSQKANRLYLQYENAYRNYSKFLSGWLENQ